MIEFSEDFSIKYTGKEAVAKRVMYRITPRAGDIPYFNGGLNVHEFDAGSDLEGGLRDLLSDFGAAVSVAADGRVTVGDISVPIPREVLNG
jgi:hypothetical protein